MEECRYFMAYFFLLIVLSRIRVNILLESSNYNNFRKIISIKIFSWILKKKENYSFLYLLRIITLVSKLWIKRFLASTRLIIGCKGNFAFKIFKIRNQFFLIAQWCKISCWQVCQEIRKARAKPSLTIPL